MDRLHLTTNAESVRPSEPGNGTVIAQVQCQCGQWTAALGHFAFETIVTCSRCGQKIAVVDGDAPVTPGPAQEGA